jgi:ABC-type nitrate/sulfonate/bicarbonate transport system permease component
MLPLAVLLGAWQLLQTDNSPYFPPPSDWCNGLVLLEKSGRLYPALLATTMTMLLGLAYHRGLAAPSDRFSNF